MLLIALILLATTHLQQFEANLHYNKFKSIATAPTSTSFTSSAALLPDTTRLTTATAYAPQQATWPPTLTRNNWFILQATADTVAATDDLDVAAKSTNQPQQQQKQLVAIATAKDEQRLHSSRIRNYDASIKPQYPVNYYTYNNNSSRNYDSMRIVEPYVLAISNQRHQLISRGESENQQAPDNSSSRASNGGDGAGTGEAVNNHITGTYVNDEQSKHNNESKYKMNTKDNDEHIVYNDNSVASKPHTTAPLFGWQDNEIKSNIYHRMDTGKYNDTSNVNDDAGVNGSVEGDGVVEGGENNINSLEDAQIDEILIPLGKILDKVKHFCEIWKQIIGESEAGLQGDSLNTIAASTIAASTMPAPSPLAAHTAATDTIMPAGGTVAQLSTEVQGRRSVPAVAAAAAAAAAAHSIMQPPQTAAAATSLLWATTAARVMTGPRSDAITASTTAVESTKKYVPAVATDTAKSLTSAALVIGRGKKWKKKLKKLLLPLLLAYKLKFFALVPLLIGGLTLLVGSTGLAGFFFALFITVMSLKGGANVNKSVLIKKDW